MVQGLKFLSKKGFNPQNQTNRKQVWEAQQQSKLEQERIRRREEELKREREDAEICQIQHGDGSQAQLRFMYNAPPGLENAKESEKERLSVKKKADSKSKDVTQIQPGDDPATAAFRRMLASSVGGSVANTEEAEGDGEPTDDDSSLKFAPVLQGSKMDPALESNPKNSHPGEGDQRSALEKAVGRKDRGGALTLEEQLARFPQLKNAPMAKGMSSTDVNVSFKPLGAQMRNVRCLSCGQWGHSRGDRECSVTGWNPFAMTIPSAVAPSNSSTVINPPASKESKSKRRYSDDSSRSHDSDSSTDSRKRRKRKSKKRKKSHKESRRRHKESRRHRRRRSRSRSESPRRRDRNRKRRSRSPSPR
ncbi:MAG: hypothetical protein SGBAC_005521 [Bacillariaceae sp.]